MPAASEAVGAPDGGCGGGDVEQEYEIRNDEGFVYKVPIRLHLDGAPSPTQPAEGTDPRAAGLSRRRRALLRLRAKRLRDLARWEALASELSAPLPAPQPPASPPASSHPATSAAPSSASILDDLLVQVEIHTEVLRKARQWCDEANALCEAHEAAIFDSIAPLPLWGRNPAELIAGLCSPAASGTPSVPKCLSLENRVSLTNTLPGRHLNRDVGSNLDEQNVCREASGVSSAADEMIKNGVGKKTMGHGLPPVLTESRMRKRVTNISGSSQASIEPKRKKASGSTSTAQGTPGSTKRRKTESTPARAPHIVCSPGPLTRRRAAAQNESPVGS